LVKIFPALPAQKMQIFYSSPLYKAAAGENAAIMTKRCGFTHPVVCGKAIFTLSLRHKMKP